MGRDTSGRLKSAYSATEISPKINSKTSKINAVKKVAIGIRKQGTLSAKSYNS